MELSSSNIKKCLIFSYMSGNGTPPPPPPKKKKKFFIFQETETLYISENGNSELEK